jgi:hypothetical protein
MRAVLECARSYSKDVWPYRPQEAAIHWNRRERMILCQRCLTRNGDDAATCAQCGSSLIPEWVGAVRRESAANAQDIQTNATPSAARDTQAPAGFSPDAFPFAPDASPGHVAPPPQPSAKPARVVVRLMLTESGYVFELAGKPEYLLGRRDTQAGLTPDVDLTDWNGAASGVSRKHAILHVENGMVSIEDLGSRNETVRNHTRLLSGKRYTLSSGDVVQLGVISLTVTILEK